jgi:hypothetical protein
MKDKFSIRAYKNADGKSPIILHLTGDYKREEFLLTLMSIQKMGFDKGKTDSFVFRK